jgi:hypothetical protein
MKRKRIGRNFDEFLKEDGVLSEVETTAIKRVIAYQIAQEMKKNNLTKNDLAIKMKTSRAALDRLLDLTNRSVALGTLERAAFA